QRHQPRHGAVEPGARPAHPHPRTLLHVVQDRVRDRAPRGIRLRLWIGARGCHDRRAAPAAGERGPRGRPSQDRRAGGLVLILVLAALTGMGIGWARGGRLGALGGVSFRNPWLLGAAIALALVARRSEERRVGKEGRSRVAGAP